jgi:hypothetical protein
MVVMMMARTMVKLQELCCVVCITNCFRHHHPSRHQPAVGLPTNTHTHRSFLDAFVRGCPQRAGRWLLFVP